MCWGGDDGRWQRWDQDAPAPSTWVHLPLATFAQQMRACVLSSVCAPVMGILPDVVYHDQREPQQIILSAWGGTLKLLSSTLERPTSSWTGWTLVSPKVLIINWSVITHFSRHLLYNQFKLKFQFIKSQVVMNNVVERKHLLVLCKRTCFHVSRIGLGSSQPSLPGRQAGWFFVVNTAFLWCCHCCSLILGYL